MRIHRNAAMSTLLDLCTIAAASARADKDDEHIQDGDFDDGGSSWKDNAASRCTDRTFIVD